MAIKPKSKVYPREIEENNPTKETLYDKAQKARTELNKSVKNGQ